MLNEIEFLEKDNIRTVITFRLPVLRAFVTAVVVCFFLLGCITASGPFYLSDEKITIKPGSLAVISGTSSKLDMLLGKALTQELRNRSTFKVLNFQEVVNQMPPPPYSVIEHDPDGSMVRQYRPNRPLVDSAYKRLKTTYLFVVWVERLTRSSRTYMAVPIQSSYYARIYGYLFRYPDGQLVGETSFENGRTPSILRSEPEAESIELLITDSAKLIVDDFVNVTNSERERPDSNGHNFKRNE